MKTNKLVIATILGASFLGLSGSANAACSFSGKVERVYQNSTRTYIYMTPLTSINSSYYRYFYTTDPDLARAAHAAKDGNHYVNVRGNGTCATSGTARFGGTLTSVLRY